MFIQHSFISFLIIVFIFLILDASWIFNDLLYDCVQFELYWGSWLAVNYVLWKTPFYSSGQFLKLSETAETVLKNKTVFFIKHNWLPAKIPNIILVNIVYLKNSNKYQHLRWFFYYFFFKWGTKCRKSTQLCANSSATHPMYPLLLIKSNNLWTYNDLTPQLEIKSGNPLIVSEKGGSSGK